MSLSTSLTPVSAASTAGTSACSSGAGSGGGGGGGAVTASDEDPAGSGGFTVGTRAPIELSPMTLSLSRFLFLLLVMAVGGREGWRDEPSVSVQKQKTK